MQQHGSSLFLRVGQSKELILLRLPQGPRQQTSTLCVQQYSWKLPTTKHLDLIKYASIFIKTRCKNLKAVIAGTAIPRLESFKNLRKEKISTSHGSADVFKSDEFAFIQRHGIDGNTPAHIINHKANIKALSKLKAELIIGVSSSGSLKPEITPGSLIIPGDYIQLADIPTFYDDKVVHEVPELDEKLRQNIISAAKSMKLKTINSGVYIQTKGPRFETKAEVKMLSHFADVVGMTMASEATLAKELEIPYASICTVDNYANGIGGAIDFEDVKESAQSNRKNLEELIRKVVG
ncbi:MAG TPA: 6-oxopurine nucleoside phosphorylase [Candidatus Altiarchaeales archaeon]|nr:6-oxopurine nucleoside phosphorylase [Candidatus Altiarchaeales archaeon]